MLNENKLSKHFSTFICKHTKNVKNNKTLHLANWEIVKNTFTKHLPKVTCRDQLTRTEKKLLHLQYRLKDWAWYCKGNQKSSARIEKGPLMAHLRSHCDHHGGGVLLRGYERMAEPGVFAQLWAGRIRVNAAHPVKSFPFLILSIGPILYAVSWLLFCRVNLLGSTWDFTVFDDSPWS